MVIEWLSISWFKHHRRSVELGQALGADVHFVHSDRRQLLLRYVDQWRRTRRLIRERAPNVIQVMQPPAVALVCVASARRPKPSVIIGDLHTGVFTDPKWRWASKLVLWILRHRGFAIVPNDELAALCREAGVEAFVSHGFVTPRTQLKPECPDGFVLAPLSYAFDEPFKEIIAAALALPHRRFVLTGNVPSAVRSAAPRNVTFPGFVSIDQYLELRDQAAMILALTNQEMTMQSAGYEALIDAKPLVTSPRRVLVQFFGDAASYAASDGRSIAVAIESVFTNYADFCRRIGERRERQLRDQLAVFDMIKRKVVDEVTRRSEGNSHGAPQPRAH